MVGYCLKIKIMQIKGNGSKWKMMQIQWDGGSTQFDFIMLVIFDKRKLALFYQMYFLYSEILVFECDKLCKKNVTISTKYNK